jgi:NhaA family Na+:H+ antiporter
VALITGIGFTMSLFIGGLAFKEEFAAQLPVDERVGILLGSALSAVAGYLVLRFALRGAEADTKSGKPGASAGDARGARDATAEAGHDGWT